MADLTPRLPKRPRHWGPPLLETPTESSSTDDEGATSHTISSEESESEQEPSGDEEAGRRKRLKIEGDSFELCLSLFQARSRCVLHLREF